MCNTEIRAIANSSLCCYTDSNDQLELPADEIDSISVTNSTYDLSSCVTKRPFAGMGPDDIDYFTNTRFWQVLRLSAAAFIFLVRSIRLFVLINL